MNATSKYRKDLDKLLVQHDHAHRQVQEERQTLTQVKEQVVNVLQAQKITQEVAQEIQNRVHAQISSVVSRCLKTVFGEDGYDFKIKFERKRGKTEARLVFCRDDQEIAPLEAAGGGAVDVASFSLRLAALVLSRPERRLLLCLDEPFRFLSKEYRPAVRELLMTLSKEMGIQIVMITHSPELTVGKVIRLGEE